jgi:predicted PurR-regulated permease PerM
MNALIWRRITGIALLIAVGALMYYFLSVVVYLMISMVLTLIGRPVCEYFNRHKIFGKFIPDWLAALGTLLIFYLIIGLYLALFVPLIVAEVQILSQINPQTAIEKLKEPLETLTRYLNQIGVQIDLYKDAPMLMTEIGKKLFSGGWISNVAGLASGLGDVVAMLFSVSFITFYFLKERHLVRDIVNAVTPDEHEPAVHRVLDESKVLLRRYLLGLIKQIAILSTLYFAGYWIIGVQNALLIGFISGVLNIIPFVGPIIGIAFSLFIVLSTSIGDAGVSGTMGAMMIVFMVVRSIDDFFLQPIIFSNSVKAHPIEIFIVILMGARVGGIVGMIVAIPVYTVLRIIAKEFLSHYKLIRELTKHL